MVQGLTVYVDDSGSNSQSTVAAAAFCVSTVRKWQKLLEKWRKIAFDAGFELKDFHMTEFAACRRDEPCQQCKNGKTAAIDHPWQNWSDQKRKSVLTRMAKAITEYVEFGVGHALTKQDYDDHVRNSKVQLIANEPIGDEYFTFAVQRCGGSLAEWRAAQSRMVPLKFVFDTASKKEKREIEKVFFAGIKDAPQYRNGVEQWLVPEQGCFFESRKQTPQLLAPDMLAWAIATLRAREIFLRGRFVELYWIAKVFVPTKNIRMGYISKDAFAQWEKGKLDEASGDQSGLSGGRRAVEPTPSDPEQRGQGEPGSGESREEAKNSRESSGFRVGS